MQEIVHEEWRPVTIFPEIQGYEVSSLGRVRSLERTVPHPRGARRFKSKVLKGTGKRYEGYLSVFLSALGLVRREYIHRLVAFAFHGIPPSDKQEVNHKDTNKRNNAAENLEWVTHEENMRQMRRVKYVDTGAEYSRAKITAEQCREIRSRYAAGGISQGELAKEFGVVRQSICYIITRKTWAHIS
jgi:hypothetical protein